MSLDRNIFKAIKRHTQEKPQNLLGILANVDSQERVLLTHEELSGGLQRLIEDGSIAELEDHKYFDTEGKSHSRTFSELSLADYEKACAAYQRWFEEQHRLFENEPTSLEDFTRQKIVIRWKLNDEDYATEADEEATEDLAEKIELALQQDKNAEVNGFEYSRGFIDILIFGKETDADTDQIYARVLAVFRSFGCPVGSYILRQYETGEELISDTIS